MTFVELLLLFLSKVVTEILLLDERTDERKERPKEDQKNDLRVIVKVHYRRLGISWDFIFVEKTSFLWRFPPTNI